MMTDTQDLLNFLYNSPSASHCTAEIERRLQDSGFTSLNLADNWQLTSGEKYYIKKEQSALISFALGSSNLKENGFRIIAAHTDSPSFKIKSAPEMSAEHTYLKLNTEPYGGPIAYTWFDRPLSLAGQVTLRTDNPLRPRTVLINFKRPLLTIPSVAIHLKNTNKEFKINNQKDMLPIIQLINKEFQKDGYLQQLISKELLVDPNDVLAFDLDLYAYERGTVLGVNSDFIQAQGLDDKWMVYAAMEAIRNAADTAHTKVAIFVDNEEVGSLSSRGARSKWIEDVLVKLCAHLGYSLADIPTILEQSTILSADLAHAVHPNAGDLHDPTNRPTLGGGPVIKVAASGSYSTDATGYAIFKQLCELADVPYQALYNRSDKRGGGTIGPMMAAALSARIIDMGTPVLAMHSIKELAATRDHEYVMKLFSTFYKL